MKITKILQTWASLLMIETKDIFYHLKNGDGSAYIAYHKFGIIMEIGVGLQGI